MKMINIQVKILSRDEKFSLDDLMKSDAVLREDGQFNYEIIKDRYGYFGFSHKRIT